MAAFLLPSLLAPLLPLLASLEWLCSLPCVCICHIARAKKTHMPPWSPIGNPAPCTHTTSPARTHAHRHRQGHAIAFEMKQKFNESWQGAKAKAKQKQGLSSATATASTRPEVSGKTLQVWATRSSCSKAVPWQGGGFNLILRIRLDLVLILVLAAKHHQYFYQ